MPSQQQIIEAIQSAAQQYHVNPALMVADARVESGLNPGAVGDNGSSFGLYQNHVGGAGGATQASARRFLDWRTSINDAARRFHGAQTAEDIYRAQRPADHAGYVAKLKAAMGGRAQLNAPVAGGGIPAGSPAPAGDDPIATSILTQGLNPVVASLLAEGGGAPSPAPASPSTGPSGPVGHDYRWIQRQGQKLFGLRNDPGSAQTTGGRHTNGSEHYSGRAVDFGNARNSGSQLAAWKRWARSQGLDVLDEGDHVHVSLPGSGI